MRNMKELENSVAAMHTLLQLSSVFEGLASIQISKVKDQVVQSQDFFNKLWQMYTQIRVDSVFHFGRHSAQEKINPKELFIIVTASGSFSGDIDQKLIDWMLKQYDPSNNDLIVIGRHGATQLTQKGIKYQRYFKLPAKDKNINVAPIIKEVQEYKNTKVFYQTYVSLTIQDIKSISLSGIVEEKGKGVEQSGEIISEDTHIFEPSTFAVVDHLERSMLQIALSQVILESKLAQYASRFRAMSSAHLRADESYSEYSLDFNRAKRAIKDKQLMGIVSGIHKAEGAVL